MKNIACALTLGMLTGYLLYAATHHDAGRLGGFGVTGAFWDHVFGSAKARAAPARKRA